MGNPGPTARRAAERRTAKLEEIQQQVKDGTLTIRQMTAAERKRWGVPAQRGVTKGKPRRQA